MKPALAALAFAALAHSAFAQDDFLPTGPATDGSTDENQRFRAIPGTPGAYQIAWWARAGRFYTPEKSTDLLSWESFPIIETGSDAAVSYGFTSDSPRVFVRLRHVASTDGDPYLLDFDGDGLTNAAEFELRTSPFSADTDGDGLPDKWENDRALDPRDPATALADSDADGRSIAQEYLEGTDPNVADASPPPSGSAPTVPGQPAVETLSPSHLRLTWNASTGGTLLGYLVERSEDNVTWSLIGFTAGNVTTFDDTQALPGTAYSYRVKGVY